MVDISEIDDKAIGQDREGTAARSDEGLLSAKTRRYGWGSRLRSYLVFDPLIWIYTVVLGLVSLPTSLFSDSGRIQHDFARFWSWLIMKTIVSPVTVTGLERIDTRKPHVYAVNQGDIVPVALLGTYALLPMNTYHIKCRPLEMRLGEPISTEGLSLKDLDALSARVQKAMEKLYYKPM
jgi:1-acyl-sn-glycerol-3-phosphate acyltransferase